MINERLKEILVKHCSEEQVQDIVSDINAIYGADLKITQPEDVMTLMAATFEGADKESLWAILLTRSNNVIKIIPIGYGTEVNSVVSIKTLAKSCLDTVGCSAVILTHNHPSGSVGASNPDVAITRKIKQGLELLDIQLLDHVIWCGQNKYYSMAENLQL